MSNERYYFTVNHCDSWNTVRNNAKEISNAIVNLKDDKKYKLIIGGTKIGGRNINGTIIGTYIMGGETFIFKRNNGTVHVKEYGGKKVEINSTIESITNYFNDRN
jgi:hypothetical protein